RRVVAVDLPGHGRTGGWRGEHRFDETARELTGFIGAANLRDADLAVLGHSWGARVVAELPAAGIRPRPLILLDPPALSMDELEEMSHDPTEQSTPDVDEAAARIREANPAWDERDIRAKAEAITRMDPDAVREILLRNAV